MVFRVSESTIFDQALRSTRLNRFALHELQSKISSGKRVTSLGDDPGAATEILGLRRGLSRLEIFERNIQGARTNLEHSEAALSSLTDVLSRLRELAVSADIEEGEFDKIKPEVEQLFDEVLRIANTEIAGRFLFGGFDTQSLPFTKVGSFVDGVVNTSSPPEPYAQYGGDNGVLQIQIGESSTVDASVTGRVIFFGSNDGDDTPDTGRVDIFDVIRDLRNRLEDPTTVGPPADTTARLDSALDQVLAVRGRLGATLNRLDIAETQLANLKVSLETQRSAVEDLDLISAATELANRENTFQASLSVTARVIQPSLLNFLG
ncbi:MAG: flagellar hook-associated protein FlgL [Myxococcota bacterium]